MNEAAKRRKILSLGREPQENGVEKIVSREAATDNHKTMAAAHAAAAICRPSRALWGWAFLSWG